MDIETLRLEREEKRRQRRERIRKILEDDPTSTRRTREETDRTTAASRRPARENTSSSASDRTRYSRSHGDVSDVTSTRSTRTSRLRENNAYSHSTRSSTNTSEDTTTSRRTTTTRKRSVEERTSTVSETTHTRSERTPRSNLASEGSSARSATTTRASRLANDAESEDSALKSTRARREARRKRNQEHDDTQNRIIAENGDVDKASKSDIENRHRTFGDKKGTEDNDLPKDCQDDVKDSRVNEGEKDIDDQQAKRDSEYISSRSDGLGRLEDVSVEEGKTNEREEPGESANTEKDSKKDALLDETKLTENGELDKLDVTENVVEKVIEDPIVENGQEEVENTSLERNEAVKTVDDLAAEDEMKNMSEEKDIDEVRSVDELESNDSEVKNVVNANEMKSEELNEDYQTSNNEQSEQADVDEKRRIATEVLEEKGVPSTEGPEIKTKNSEQLLEEKGVLSTEGPESETKKSEQLLEEKGVPSTEGLESETRTSEQLLEEKYVNSNDEPESETRKSEQLLEETPLEPLEPLETIPVEALPDNSIEAKENEESMADQELVVLDDVPEIPLNLVDENNAVKSPTETDAEANENTLSEGLTELTSKQEGTHLESIADCITRDSAEKPNDSSEIANEPEKAVSPDSPRNTKFIAKSDETDAKESQLRTKSNVSRTKSDSYDAKDDRLGERTGVERGRKKSADSGIRTSEGETKIDKTSLKSDISTAKTGTKVKNEDAKNVKAGKLKVGDGSWQKNVRKKKGVSDFDRAVELRVLGRTGKIKNKMLSCETRDVESADQWKKEVKKTPRKHKSFDEETEKELRELSRKRELKNIVQSCEVNDQESADAWKREVKKGPKKHKSLDEDAESELREISKSNILKSRIKECEEKDKESAEAWKKEVKKEGKPKDAENETEVSEDLKELSGSGRLKDLISSCAERDAQKEKSWESAKQEVKSADEEAELQELASLSETKSKIIQQYEERDKESAESGKKKIKTGEGTRSFDETTDEELLEISKTVDVKTRIQLTHEEQTKPREIVKQNDLLEDEELKEINLKGRLEAFKQETEKHVAENKDRKTPSKVSKPAGGRVSPSKGTTDGRISPNKDVTKQGRTSPTKGETGRISPKKGDSDRTSPTKDRPRSTSGRVSPSKDKTSGRVSPTKDRSKTMDDTSSSSSTRKDKTRSSSTVGDTVGRVSPSKDRGRISPTRGDNGRGKETTPTGRTSPTKRDGRKIETPSTKRDAKGRISPSKDINTSGQTKLDSIRANLMDGGKNKIKPKRESLDRVSKSTSIKDKIAACKERDETAPRTITLPKTVPKAKAKSGPDKNTLNEGNDKAEAGENESKVPVNRQAEQFMTIEEEMQGASIKGALSFWKEPGAETKVNAPDDDENTTAGRDSPPKDIEKPPPVILSNVKQGWQKRTRKLNVAEFIKELLHSNCKRRELKDIQDIKSETKKYLAGGMHAEETRASTEKTDIEDKEGVKVQLEKEETTKKDVGTTDKTAEFSFDDVVNPNEVKQLRDFSNFRRQVRPANRRAAKSNPVRKLQQREDLKTGTESFNDVDDEDEDEEDAPLKPTAFGRLGRAIEPGDRQSKDLNKFAADALAGLSAKEDVSKITLKKTSKSKAGVSQEKGEHDGTAPVMLLQVKGHRHMQTRLVEPSVDSLNSTDSFVLVTDKYLHVWNGKDSNVMKKSKASELSNKILQYKLLNCNATVVTIIKDGGVNVGTGLTRTFWNILGGKKNVKGSKEVPKDSEYEKAVVSSNVVYAVDTSNDTVKLKKMPEYCGKIPKINMLDSNKAFVFDFGTEVYAWLGRTCDKATRTKAVDLAQEIYKAAFEVHNSLNPITPNTPTDDDKSRQLKRPSWALFGRMTERAETILFEQKFLDWPDVAMKIKLDKEKDLLNKNLSKGYAKRIAKIEKSEYQAVELVPYDGAKMGEEPPPVKLILEGVNVGRGRGSYDEIERRGLSVTTNSVTVYHSSEKESRQLEEKEWGHFYSAESYVIRWSYSVKASGIRSLKGGESKRDTTGRDQIAYFFWHGRDCSASGKGTSALATIELDSDKSPQIMVDEGLESACFLNMFDGQMIVHHGKLDEAKSIDEDNVFMYCVHHEDEREISLTQIEARSSNLRSRSSFVVVVIDEAIGVCVWHGAKSTKEKKQGALRGAKRLATWFQSIFEIKKVDIVELEEGHEENLFWMALDGKADYGSLQGVTTKCDNRVRLFTFLSTEGPFLAREILNSTRGEHVSPYPFRQANIYDATQPALFLVDVVHEMYLWQGWWPGNPEESESATTTGSAEFRWHRDRKLAMQSVQSYADSVGRQMSKAYVVNAGLEPIEFRALFPFWEDHPDVTRINFESGKVDGKKESMTELLAKLSRDRYTLAELLVRTLPEGVDPLKMEMYLSDEEFQDVFSMNKDEFNKLPKWKKLDQRKKAGLF